MVRTCAERLGSDRKGMEWNHFQTGAACQGADRRCDAMRGLTRCNLMILVVKSETC
jgi:hypothetical protein